MRYLLPLILLAASTPAAFAGWPHCRACQPTYRQVVHQPQPVTTTIVNNLVGIPVPVQYTEPIAAQGSSVYGYSGLSDYEFPAVDMGLLYNQAARLTDQAQQLAGQASTDFATLVQAEGQNQADVARIMARGLTAREVLKAAASGAEESPSLSLEAEEGSEQLEFGLVTKKAKGSGKAGGPKP